MYLDNNATTPLAEEVKKEMADSAGIFGNASSMHKDGMLSRNLLEKARQKVSSGLGCSPDELIFTGCGTESDNIAIQGFLRGTDKKHIITSKIEHPAVLNVFKYLHNNGYEVTYLDVDEYGAVDPELLAGALRKDTALVSIMTANNEIGTIQPVKEISERIREYSKDIVFHTDAVQGFGKTDIDVKKMGVDMMSVSAHKINGPKGVGALFIRKGVKIKPVFIGGHHERGLRPGTENVQGIAGFGKAVEIAMAGMKEKNEKTGRLRDKLKEGIIRSIPNIKINGHPETVLPNTLNVSFRDVEGESIIMMLDMEGISVSTGSACTSGTLEASHVLLSIGLDHASAQGSVRFSLGVYNNEQEIGYVLEKLPGIISRLRDMSPLAKKSECK